VAWALDLQAEGQWELVILPVAVAVFVVWRWAVNFARWRRGG
jgi:hypothetical protein